MAGRERQQRVMGGQAAKGGKQRASARRNRTEGTAAGAPKSAKEVRSGGQDWPGLPWRRRGPCEGGETTRLRFVTDDSPQRRPRSGLALQKKPGLGADFSGAQFLPGTRGVSFLDCVLLVLGVG